MIDKEEEKLRELINLHTDIGLPEMQATVGYGKYLSEIALNLMNKDTAAALKDVVVSEVNNISYNASAHKISSQRLILINRGILDYSYHIYKLVIEYVVHDKKKSEWTETQILEMIFDFVVFIATEDLYSLKENTVKRLRDFNSITEDDIRKGVSIELFFLLHEYGHIYHKHSVLDKSYEIEYEADNFAINHILGREKTNNSSTENNLYTYTTGVCIALNFYELVERVANILFFDKSLKQHPSSQSRWKRIKKIAYRNEDLDDLILYLENLFDRLINRSENWLIDNIYSTARIHHLKGNNIKAKEYLDKLASYSPNHAYGIQALGNFYSRTGNLSSAETLLRKSLSIDNNNAFGWYDLAGILANRNKLEESIQAYNMAWSLDSTNPKILVNRGSVYAELGKFESAITDLYMAKKKTPDDYLIYVNLVSIYLLKEDKENAYKNFNELNRFDSKEAKFIQSQLAKNFK